MKSVRTRYAFAIGFTGIMALMLFLNIIPYLWCVTFPAKDAIRTLGFPFEFHKQGGKHGVFEFHYWMSLIDAGFALIVAFEIGYLFRRIQSTDHDGRR